MYNVNAIRADFPILSREVNGKPLVYLDNGASAQKPQVVIDTITRAYAEEYSNVHRGLHYLSNLATENYEAVRGKIARFLNAPSENDIIMNSGTTEGINTVAYGWAMPQMEAGDEIILSVMEHHANIVPWHFLRERQGVVLKWVDGMRPVPLIRKRFWTRSPRRQSWSRLPTCLMSWAPRST